MRLTRPPTSRTCRRRVRGGSSAEYMLILALVVIPLALMVPFLLGMINVYTTRIGWAIRLPFG